MKNSISQLEIKVSNNNITLFSQGIPKNKITKKEREILMRYEHPIDVPYDENYTTQDIEVLAKAIINFYLDLNPFTQTVIWGKITFPPKTIVKTGAKALTFIRDVYIPEIKKELTLGIQFPLFETKPSKKRGIYPIDKIKEAIHKDKTIRELTPEKQEVYRTYQALNEKYQSLKKGSGVTLALDIVLAKEMLCTFEEAITKGINIYRTSRI